MSEPILAESNDDMPCTDWIGTGAEIKDCPMKQKWREGDSYPCPECGWTIEYCSNFNQ